MVCGMKTEGNKKQHILSTLNRKMCLEIYTKGTKFVLGIGRMILLIQIV